MLIPHYEPLAQVKGSGELKRKLRGQGEPNPPIFVCLKQSRCYQNDLACIKHVKKLPKSFSVSHPLIQTGNF